MGRGEDTLQLQAKGGGDGPGAVIASWLGRPGHSTLCTSLWSLLPGALRSPAVLVFQCRGSHAPTLSPLYWFSDPVKLLDPRWPIAIEIFGWLLPTRAKGNMDSDRIWEWGRAGKKSGATVV